MSSVNDNTESHQKADLPAYRFLQSTGASAAMAPYTSDTVVSNSFEAEDEFAAQSLYVSENQGRTNGVIQPPYNLKTLDRLTQENNALGPCIEAMVTNVDGTGFDFYKDDGKLKTTQDPESEDPKINELWDFFSETYPGESFISLRKRVTRDRRKLGNGYFEVIRNVAGDITLLKYIDAKMVRLVQLDNAITVTKKLRRKGTDVEIKIQVRERRYAQLVNGKTLRYFKEFGSQRDLDKNTGEWAPKGRRLGFQKRASEIVHLIDLPDAHTPYGVPSWVAQMPSVLGSRYAEEFNLDFFKNGGVPPVLILVHGGVLAHETRAAIKQGTMGMASAKNKIQVIEAEPTGGSIDSSGTARITVERFGSERQDDSMFENYDEKCEQRIRRAFRLPPIFVGQATDYSFATAYASYVVAEAQVFKPERDAFDEMMSIKVLPEMGYGGYRMRSNPLQLNDTTLVLQGIATAQSTGHVDPKDIVLAVNSAIGTNFRPTEAPITPPQTLSTATLTGGKNSPQTQPKATPDPSDKTNPTQTRR